MQGDNLIRRLQEAGLTVARSTRRRWRRLRWQRGRCYLCFRLMTMSVGADGCTLDHRQPKGKGGADDDDNLSGACRRCNQLKGDLTVAEFRARWPDPSLMPEWMGRISRSTPTTDAQRAARRAWRKAVREIERERENRTLRSLGDGSATLALVWPRV